jgi:activator of 2-hydroxyglutaryl-CoA dehydratase
VIQQPGGGSHEFTIETSVTDALDEYLDEAVDEIANVFLPELASDHIRIYRRTLEEPIVLTGRMANVPGIVKEFETRLSAALDREVTARAPDDPTLSPARGAHRIASRFVEIEDW